MDASREWLGASAEEVAESLCEFTESSALLSSDPELVDKYALKWVGVCAGEVKASEEELDDLLRELDSKGVPRSRTVVRFIEKEQRTLIL